MGSSAAPQGQGNEASGEGNRDWPAATTFAAYVDPGAAVPAIDPASSNQIHKFFSIHVVDKASGENIPGAIFETTNKIQLQSDKNGFIAFYEPGLMKTKVWFTITHPGWERAKDFFGNAGLAIDVTEGGSLVVELEKKSGAKLNITHDRDTQLLLRGTVPLPAEIAGLRVVDSKTKRGVPLVLLKTAAGDVFYTDNQGYVATFDSQILGTEVSMQIRSDGYVAKEVKAKAEKGKILSFEIERRNLAERLYRSTGGGSYRDSVLLGLTVPVAKPNVDGLVAGQDTVNALVYKDKLFWIWQDTSRFAYPLGNFGNSGAFAELPGKGNISQDLGMNRSYFVDSDGFSRPMTPGFEPASAPTWMGSLVTVKNSQNVEKMYGIYGKATSEADIGKSGWGVYDDASNTFKDVPGFAKAEYVAGRPLTPKGDPVRVMHGSKEYLYYGAMRVPASEQSLLNIDAYETYSPYQEKSVNPNKDSSGGLLYAWKKNSYPAVFDDLVKSGISQKQILDELNFRDMEGQQVKHAGKTLEKNWNAFRKRYIGTIQQQNGTSLLGETWLSEADTPLGPWNFAKKVISHDKYTFYNVQQHPFFDREMGRIIYIDGTYTNFFTNEKPTPRYDYNQVMYRVDLASKELAMPVAVYDLDGSGRGDFALKGDLHPSSTPMKALFFANESKADNLQGLSWSLPACNPLRKLKVSQGEPSVFFAVPPTEMQSELLQSLYEFRNASGAYAYSVNDKLEGYERLPQPIALVWKSLSDVKLPVGEYLGDLVANAGADQCLTASSGTLTLNLDGSQSLAQKAPIVSYEWRVMAQGLSKSVTGMKASLELSKGVYFVELRVTDDTGLSSVDRAMVEIK